MTLKIRLAGYGDNVLWRPLACLLCGRYKILDEDDPLYCGGHCLRNLEDTEIDSD